MVSPILTNNLQVLGLAAISAPPWNVSFCSIPSMSSTIFPCDRIMIEELCQFHAKNDRIIFGITKRFRLENWEGSVSSMQICCPVGKKPYRRGPNAIMRRSCVRNDPKDKFWNPETSNFQKNVLQEENGGYSSRPSWIQKWRIPCTLHRFMNTQRLRNVLVGSYYVPLMRHGFVNESTELTIF